MPALYILDVGEFSALVKCAAADASLTIRKSGSYHRIETDGEIVIRRGDTNMGEAVWFGALVGGFEGRLVEFTDAILRIGQKE
jgi:hypothetical protein